MNASVPASASQPARRCTEDIDLDGSGLLNRVTGQAHEDRRELIDWLRDGGFELDCISGAHSPILLATNRVLGDDGTRCSAHEVAESAGVPVELLQRLHNAIGLTDARNPDALHSRADAQSVLAAVRLTELGLDPRQVVLAVRLLSEGLRKTAETLRRASLQALLHPGSTERELAQSFERLAHDARPVLDDLVHDLFRFALRQSVDTETVDLAERAAGELTGVRQIGIAFADLVGFTQLGETLPPQELVAVAAQLGDLARGVTDRPVQFVKVIGDAVMLVSPDPNALLSTVFELIDAAAAVRLPRLRAGVVFGAAVNHAGDWYGSSVNLASRVTGAAAPASVLADEATRTAVGDVHGIEFLPAQRQYLKGIRGPVHLHPVCRVRARESRG